MAAEMAFDRKAIALFDFDGTITTKDSFCPFISFALGQKALCKALFMSLDQLLLYPVGLSSRRSIKEKILFNAFGHIESQKFLEVCNRFANEYLDSLVKRSALQRIEWHLMRGDRCLLVSAGLEAYLKPWGKRHGFADVLATRLQVDDQDRLTGRLEGENCRGKEKVIRIQEYLSAEKIADEADSPLLFAYGDSRGDDEMLALADHAFYRFFS